MQQLEDRIKMMDGVMSETRGARKVMNVQQLMKNTKLFQAKFKSILMQESGIKGRILYITKRQITKNLG